MIPSASMSFATVTGSGPARRATHGCAAQGPARSLQVQCQAFFVGVQCREDRRFLPPLLFGDGNAGDQSGAVRAAGGFHVDDVGAEHGQEVGAAGPRPERRHIQYAEPAERQPIRGPGRHSARGQGGGPLTRGVFTQPRRRPRFPKLRGPHPVGVAWLVESVARIAHKRGTLLEVVQRCDVRAVGHRRVGNAECPCELPDLVDWVALHPPDEPRGAGRFSGRGIGA